MKLKGWLIVAALGVTSLVLLVFGDQWVDAILKKPKIEVSQISAPMGELSGVQGRVRIQSHKGDKFKPIKAGGTHPLHNLDSIKVERGGSALIKFNSGYSLKLTSQTRITLEYWNPSQGVNSPVFVNFEEGNYSLENQGKVGQLYIVQSGSVFVPSQRPKKKRRIVIIRKEGEATTPQNEETTSEESSSNTSETEKQDTAEAVRGIPALKPKKILSDRGLLTTEYLEERLLAQNKQLHKCQNNSLKNNNSAAGNIDLSLVLGGTGKVKTVRVIQSTMTDPQLQKCVVSVIERMRFHSFTGPDIQVRYPIRFE